MILNNPLSDPRGTAKKEHWNWNRGDSPGFYYLVAPNFQFF